MSDQRAVHRHEPAVISGAGGRIGPAVLLALCACVYDGQYVVRGTVAELRGAGPVPLAGAEVRVSGHTSAAGPPQSTRTEADGRFAIEYRFGGMGFLLFTPGDGEPTLAVTAPGHREVRVPVRDGALSPGVTRRRCPDRPKGCFEFGFDLAPQ